MKKFLNIIFEFIFYCEYYVKVCEIVRSEQKWKLISIRYCANFYVKAFVMFRPGEGM